MSRELIIYCDESDISGRHFSNFYGGALVESVHQHEVIERLEGRKVDLGFGAEVKWQKISEAYADRYISFAEEVFALIREGKLKMRVMFTQNYFAPAERTRRDAAFFVLYYQFVKHAFGLRYAGNDDCDTGIRMHFDILPDTHEKSTEFKQFVFRLNQNQHFERARIRFREDQIAEVDSKHHVIMQGLDVVLGAMQFRLNDKHKEKPEGQRIRGKRTRAKERVYKEIYGLIRTLYPGYQFNIGISTGMDGNPAALWHDPYRHWLFLPREMEIRREYAKRQRPAAAT